MEISVLTGIYRRDLACLYCSAIGAKIEQRKSRVRTVNWAGRRALVLSGAPAHARAGIKSAYLFAADKRIAKIALQASRMSHE
jgi:hypothetical protein